MKGVIFTLFQDMVEDNFGLECWEELLEATNLESEGVFTVGKTYPDEELFQLVQQLAIQSDKEVPVLIEVFGRYLFPHLMASFPEDIISYQDLWSFLAAVDDVIHIEVKKLSPDALTPEVKVVDGGPEDMTLAYRSPRKLCFLAVGLIYQAAEHFKTSIKVSQMACMHDGNDCCLLRVRATGDG